MDRYLVTQEWVDRISSRKNVGISQLQLVRKLPCLCSDYRLILGVQPKLHRVICISKQFRGFISIGDSLNMDGADIEFMEKNLFLDISREVNDDRFTLHIGYLNGESNSLYLVVIPQDAEFTVAN